MLILPSMVRADCTQESWTVVREIMCRLQVADRRVEGEVAVGVLHLAHDLRRDRPVVVQIDLERGAAALGLDVVVILLHQLRVVERDAGSREGHRAVDVVDVTRILLVPADQAHGGAIGERDVDEAFEVVTRAAVIDGVAFEVVAAA